jgi:hypothetical protein
MSGAGAAKADWIKWWDVLDMLRGMRCFVDASEALQMARDCQHPDAQWLVSLFPVGVDRVLTERLRQVVLEQGDDSRAVFLWNLLARGMGSVVRLRRAAESGFAPAQAALAENLSASVGL